MFTLNSKNLVAKMLHKQEIDLYNYITSFNYKYSLAIRYQFWAEIKKIRHSVIENIEIQRKTSMNEMDGEEILNI